jgi:predicted permease
VRVKKPEGFDAELMARVARLPGVESATAMDPVPLWYGENASFFSIDADSSRARLGFSRIGPQYFATLRIPLLHGREFVPTDTRTSPGVVIVNETMARQFWPDGAALGHQVREGNDGYEVVGVVRDSRQTSLAERARPWVYRPLTQEPTDNPSLSLAVRFSGDPSKIREQVQREALALVPAWPVFHFRALDEGLALQRLVPRLGATLLGVLGAIGLLLAAIGMYGVTAYVVKQRTREIGIRLALGSPVPRVVALVMRQGMGVCATGAAVGIALALSVSRFLDRVLVQTASADLLTYAAVTSILLVVALLACYLPSRAVACTHPLDALRDE